MKSLKLFQTKKRSSRQLWSFWMLLLSFAAAVGATLFVSELLLISNKKVVFTTFAAPTIIDWKKRETPNTASAGEKTIVVLFSKDYVVVGSAQDITAPPPKGAVVFVDRQNWQSRLESELLKSPSVLSLFPTRTFGFASDSETTNGQQPSYKEVLDIISLINSINRRKGLDERTVAVPFLVDMKSGFLGVN